MQIHKAKQIFGKLSYGEWRRTPRRPPMPTRVDGDDAEMLGKMLYLVSKIAAVLPITMQKNQRLSGALLNVMIRDIHALYPSFRINSAYASLL